MIRYKTFDSTGLATAGRLYSGDLNAIQDASAGLSDFTQTVDVNILRIANTGLQLVSFSSTELRVTGKFRADGIITSGGSNAGGILPGTFTTTQRNALGAGLKPYGMALVNSTTNQWEWNSGSDGSPVWKPLGLDPSGSFSFTGATSSISWTAENASATILSSQRSGDSAARWTLREDGYGQFGGGTSGVDTGGWYRNAAAVLRTPSSVVIDGSLSVAGLTLATFVVANGLPPGAVIPYGGASLPTYYVWADGATYDGTNPLYTPLWNNLQLAHGGSGQSSFKVPDTRGRAPIGFGTHSDVSTLGSTDGLAVGSRTFKHFHGKGTLNITSSGSHAHGHSLTLPDHTHNYGVTSSGADQVRAQQVTGNEGARVDVPTGSVNSIPAINGSITAASHTHASADFAGSVGTTSGVSEAPAWIVLNFICKL